MKKVTRVGLVFSFVWLTSCGGSGGNTEEIAGPDPISPEPIEPEPIEPEPVEPEPVGEFVDDQPATSAQACVDVPTQSYGLAPAQGLFVAPDSTNQVGSSGTALEELLWENGSTLQVAFIGGSDFLRQKVIDIASTWESFANIDFEFVESGRSDIRVSFELTGRSWSRIGKDALNVAFNEPTMNFGWFTPTTSEEEFSRTILHEFGHALGLVHEHSNPTGGVPWDREAVLEYYSGPPNNWTEEQIVSNVLSTYSRERTSFTSFDRSSIMLYAIPDELTQGDFSVGWNTQISATDANFIRYLYPAGSRVLVDYRAERMRFECRKGSDRGCTAIAQQCLTPRQANAFIDTSTVSVELVEFFGRQPLCRIESISQDQVCYTGYVESGSGGGSIGTVFYADCLAELVERPTVNW